MTEPANARDLFRAAYEHRYTWDANFPGYSADIELKQGDEVYTGVYTQMRDIVTHRKRSTFEKSHGKNSFTLGEKDSTDAVDILVQGDSMGSNYKIRGLSICQVSRVMGRMAFVIDTHNSLETPEGSLASHYDAVFRNPETNEIIRELEFEDTFDKIGDYYVMTKQVVRSKEKGQLTTTEFNYSNVKLLEPAVV
ncbi:MAG: DUF3386 domain-containing protein [Oscillatoriales cyanobacterium]|nr:MAG: DUF3386 domain-containing protein [Oscillatoriales cyanobacterium]